MNPFEREVVRVAGERGLHPRDVLSASRKRPYARARQEAMWRLNLRGNALPRIGQWAGMDHTTILHGVRVHQAIYEAAHAARWPA